MKKKLSEGRESKRQALLRKKKEEPAAFWTYVVLRFIVILILIRCILRGDIESAFVCVLVLVIYLLPQFVENRLNIDIPTTFEVIIFVFVFAAEILGELQSYFIKYSNWDTILHTSSGFLCAAVGFSLVDLLNRSDNAKVQLSPGYLAITAFCFSMTIGILWEFIEFSADRLFLLDMQKDTIVNQISSVSLDPTNSNISITVKGIKDVILVTDSGEQALGLGGFLDIGLYDTMEDLFVNFVGAVVFSVVAFFECKSEKRPLTTALTLRRKKKPQNT
ncbi:MAG TPA: hypothetical protein IAD36_03880 [Candidatus Scatomorpha intestinigallinarum]|uniref:Uncharacterized protein n=1 Tax=Candidatus Scatomorpha intestinigallinarum TaxID=2840923 RepID=A0A9D1IYV4_9FIRM|nr:hypothetical protein [Candidatus Scatomorpha intestinigallinarum]